MRRIALAASLLVACSQTEPEGVSSSTTALQTHEPAALALATRLAPESIRSFLRPTSEGLRVEDGAMTTPAERALDPAFDGVGARLPFAADGAIEVGLSRIPRFRGSLRLLGVRGVQGQAHEGRALYPEAWKDTDLIFVAGHARLESLFLVRSNEAPSTWTLSLSLPSGVVDVRERSDRLELLDALSEPVLYLPRPFAVDAEGRHRDLDTRVTRPTPRELVLSLHLDTRGLALPLLVDPAIESSVWTNMGATGSNGAVGYAMAYDPDRKVVVQYGGSTVGCASCAQTWEYAASAWSQKCTSCGPGGRDGAGMVYDSVNKRMIVAMGVGQTDAWAWKASTWTKLSLPALEARSRLGFSIKPGTTIATVFGGQGTFSYPTGSLDLATGFSPSIPFSAPSNRYGSPMVWDSTHNYFVLFSGSNGAADTWTQPSAGANWSVVTPTTSPAARVDHGLAFDSTRGKTVLFGGTVDNKTWEFNGTNWVDMTPSSSPATRSQMQLVFATHLNRVVLFGGKDTGSLFYNDTWEYHARGGACTASTQCDTGHCVDGVCCETASCGSCEACNTATLPGVCNKVVSADDDTCNGTKTCNAAGVCKSKNAQTCTLATDCASGNCIDGYCCSSVCGVCSSCAINPGTCTPVTSAPDPDTCSGLKSCDVSGSCKGSVGATCATTAECSSGFCVDGVCCESLCNGQCEACNLTGNVGKCMAVTGAPAGSRPVCKNSGTTCGGTCDGKKRDACVYLDAATKCDAKCAGATFVESLCDGAGACVEQTPKTCLGGFKCDSAGTACLTKCSGDTDCAGGLVCGTDGLCVPNSATCDGDHTTSDATGKKTDCSPYKCESNGTCRKACTTSDECVASYLCNGSQCIPGGVNGAEGDDGGGCSVGRNGERHTGFGVALVAIALSLVARRLRATGG